MNKKAIKILTLSVIVSNYLFAGGSADCPTDGSGHYLVTNSDDDSSESTFKACVYHAGNSGSDATVTFDNDMIITLSRSVLLNGANHLTIDAQANDVTISGDNSQGILFDNNSNMVTLKNLTLAEGDNDNGGALHIDSNGDFEMQNIIFEDNGVSGDINGSAIYIDSKASKDTLASVSISNCIFSHNSAKRGTIFIEDNVSVGISNTQFLSNTTKEGGAGLFVGKDVTLQINDVNFTKNKLTYDDDYGVVIAFDTNSSVNINDSLFNQNDSRGICCGSDGVALITMIRGKTLSINTSEFVDNNTSILAAFASENVNIENSIIKNNDNLDDFHRFLTFYQTPISFINTQITNNYHYAELLYSYMGEVIIEDSKFNANTSADVSSLLTSVGADTIIDSTEFDDNTNGVALVFYYSNATLKSSSITNNHSIAQIYASYANLDIKNTTISTNTDVNGTLIVSDSNITIDSSTIYNNINTDSTTPSAGIHSTSNAKIDIANSILTNNTADGTQKNSNQDLDDVIYSIVGSDVTATTFLETQVGVDPKLKALEYDGNTKIHALESDSPAINKGRTLLSTDQRGVKRDSSPDIGAYEKNSGSLAPIYYLLMF